MPSFNIPLLMVVAFLLLTLGVAFYFTKTATTFRAYAVGDKDFPTGNLVATLLATAYGGGVVMNAVEQIHSRGFFWILFGLLSSCFTFWFISRLAMRMAPFMHHLSMSETIGSVYGRYPRIITTLSHLFLSIAMIAIQINVMSMAISMCIESTNPKIITTLAILILIFYSAVGGIRAVMVTDIMQLVAFCIVFPLLAWWLFMKMGKPLPEIISFLQTQEKFQFSSVCHADTNLVAMIALLLSYLMICTDPPIIQRIYMSADHFQASKVFWNAGIASLFMTLCILLLGLFTFAAAPELPVTEVWSYIVENIPPIFKGFVTISLLALAMSTADSYLNSCAVMFSHDVVNTMMHKKAISYTYQLRLARLVALFIGIFAVVISFYYNDLIDLTKSSLDCFVPIVTAPFILAILGFRGTERTALIGMATGTVAILAWNKWVEPTTGINGSFVCMLTNGLTMMAAHYLLPQSKA